MRHEFTKHFKTTFKNNTIDIFYYRGYNQVADCLLGELLELQGSTIYIDIETCARPQYKHIKDAALRPEMSRIRLLQIFEPQANKVWILDFQCPEQGYLLKNRFIVNDIFKLLDRNLLIAHNAAFEMNQLQHVWATHNDNRIKWLNINCTMNMFRLVVCAKTWDTAGILGGSLKICMKLVCGVNIDKAQQTSDWGIPELSQEQLDYAASDAYYLPALYDSLYKEIKDYGLEQIFLLDSEMLNVTSSMKFHGVTIDPEAHLKLATEWEQKVKEYGEQSIRLLNNHLQDLDSKEIYNRLMVKVLKKQQPFILEKLPQFNDGVTLDQLAELKKQFKQERENIEYSKSELQALKRVCVNIKENFLVNPRSDKQLSEWITKNLPPEVVANWPKTESGKQLSVNAEAFENALYVNEELEAINNFKTYSKLESTYGRGLSNHFFVDHHGRTKIYGDFQTCWPDTGRMSCREPNLQNQGRKAVGLRSCFISRGPEYRLVVADFSMIEVRIAAHLSGDEVLLEAFRNQVDIHTKMATIILGMSLEEFKSHDKDWQKSQRNIAKAVTFATLYGGGARRIQSYAKTNFDTIMTDEEAQEAVALFRDTYPQFRQWQLEVSREANRTRTTNTMLGKFRTLHPDFTFSNSMNHPDQGTAAEIFKLSAIKITKRFLERKLDAHICNLIHDEVVADCHEDEIEETTEIIESSMCESMLQIFPDATTKGLVEAHVGIDWFSAKQ